MSASLNFLPIHLFHQTQLVGNSVPQLDLNRFSEMFDSTEFSLKQFESMKKEIVEVFKSTSYSNTELNQFIEKSILWGFSNNEYSKMFSFLSETFNLDQLTALAEEQARVNNEPFTPIDELVDQRADLYKILDISTTNVRPKAWKKSLSRILNFIPNIIMKIVNLIINTFSYLDTQKKFTSLWDRYSLIDILYKFILIPVALTTILTPILVTTAKVYLVAALIIVVVGLAIAAYRAWVKPVPDDILNCENLDKRMKLGKIEPKVGPPVELDRLKAALMSDSNVLLIGDSGSGKTALVEYLVQQKKEGILPPKLQALHNFLFDCGALRGSNTYGYSELIYQTKDQIEGKEHKLGLFFDELDQISSDKSCFEAFKKHFFSEGDGLQIIAATTRKGYVKINEEVQGSFGRRTIKIFLDNPDTDRFKLILRDFLIREANDISFDEEAIATLVQLVQDTSTYSPNIGHIAKAKQLMKEIVGECRYTFTPNYTPSDLTKLRNKYNEISSRIAASFNTEASLFQERKELKMKIVEREKLLEKQKKLLDRIQKVVIGRNAIKLHYSKLSKHIQEIRLSSPNKLKIDTTDEQAKKLILLYHFYASKVLPNQLEKLFSEIEKTMENGNQEMALRIDSQLVKKTFEGAQKLEITLNKKDEG